MDDLRCPDHGVPMALKDSRFGKFFSCPEWPRCDYKVGCHPGTDKPLGTPANAETRKARIEAHDAFDRLWRGEFRIMRRGDAYRDLARELGIDPDDCHIGMFDVETCARVVAFAERLAGEFVPEMYPADEWGDLGSES